MQKRKSRARPRAWIGVGFITLALSFSANATERNRAERDLFVRTHPCPSTGKPYGHCPGYVVDHVIALACGGPDSVENLQWQTVADACEKDKWELQVCGKQYLYRRGRYCK